MIQQLHIELPNNNNNDTIPPIATIPETNDGTEVSTLSSGIPTIYFNYDNPTNQHNMITVIKNEIFHKYKYVRSKCDLDFSTHQHSLAQMILNSLKLSEDQTIRQICWNQIRYLVPRHLNYTRTIKLNAIKLKYERKSNKLN